jgi:hypothetical protein
LLFAALFSRALIPAGFMPGAGGIVLCSGYAPVPAMDMPGMDMSGSADQGAGGPTQRHGVEFCPYTAVASVMAAGHAAALTTFTPFVPSDGVFPPEKSLPRGTIVPTSLPRGPPLSV